MFSVIFEVRPGPGKFDDYLGVAKTLRPEIEKIDGFVDNVRFKSLSRDGLILSLSSWRDEKSLVRWRTQTRHHFAQAQGREEILADYHLRVGQIVDDNQLPSGQVLKEHRLDETEVGEATAVTVVTLRKPIGWAGEDGASRTAQALGMRDWTGESTSWDIFEAVLTPGDLAILISWRPGEAGKEFQDWSSGRENIRCRRVRVIRDYGKYDRREAPQYYPDVSR